jgi:hypothetical protein
MEIVTQLEQAINLLSKSGLTATERFLLATIKGKLAGHQTLGVNA